MLTRRRLMLAGAAISATASHIGTAMAASDPNPAPGAVVVQATGGGHLVAVDPFSGIATPLAPRDLPRACHDTPQALRCEKQMNRAVPTGAATYRQCWPANDAHLVLAGRGSGATWWYWRDAMSIRTVDLPLDLDPAFDTNTHARWYHGALADELHLGTGMLRLLAFDLADGAVVLDRMFDRRLELAATNVSTDGALVAHVQGGNTSLDLWMADLARNLEFSHELLVETAPVAPASIDLRVGSNEKGSILAAGASWAVPDHPDPFVVTVGIGEGEPTVTTTPGKLVAMLPDAI